MFSFKKLLYVLTFFYLCTATATAQIDTTMDDTDKLVVVIGYPLQKSPASVDTIQPMLHQPSFTLVSGLNTLPGVRMEERSPGSYRLSIRGSLLRSPFGVRNIKMYLDDFPLTDAGGNTYLNALDASAVSSMEIWRGPYGSLYGANTGGVVRIRTYESTDTNNIKFSLNGGSYGLFQQTLRVQQKWKKHFLSVNQACQQSDGYRNHSALKRQYYQVSYQVDYHKRMRLKALAFYSDVYYQTPGGLTWTQYENNPRSARPATASVSGAVQQGAYVQNKMIYGGISHDAHIGKKWRHVLSIFTTQNTFVNPAIASHETRKEATYGTRTYLETSGAKSYRFTWNWNVGLEWQKTHADILNYLNDRGMRDTLQAHTNLNARQYFFFTQFSSTLFNRLVVEAGMSLNNYSYLYRAENQNEDWRIQQFKPQLLPRIAVSYRVREQLLWRASVSKGYSAPTIAEIRPNNNLVYADLEPEHGWNYETGLRFQNKRLLTDAAVFYYELKQAIVSRNDVNGTQYFVNSGGTRQPGLETKLSYQLIKKRSLGTIRHLELKNSFTYYVFSFGHYVIDAADYSGNRLTGVPRTTVVTSMYIEMFKGLYLYLQYNYTSGIPLNDANTVYASSYHLLQAKFGYNVQIKQKTLGLYIGADNLLNEQYSLGNDLNAFGSRYYNAAPLRNFYAGMSFQF
jgi:iron complex outermembrane receptor protein